jgi:hypothetical protein
VPPTPHFETKSIISAYEVSSVLEKTAVWPVKLSEDFGSDASTLVGSSHMDLSKEQEHSLLPAKRYLRVLRHLRYTLLTVYRRLFTFIFILNIIPLIPILHLYPHGSIPSRIDLESLATAASTNFLIAILIRQDFTVNAIFRTAWLVPWSLPLRVRRWVARCYCYGGIHSGAAMAGTLWWIGFAVSLTIQFAKEALYTVPIVVLTLTIATLLITVITLSTPKLRSRHHNTFETTHRFLGWSAIALFWAQLLLLTHHTWKTSMGHESFATLLIQTPTFWNLILITAMLIYPWLRLRKWTFTPEVLSSHAIRLHFRQKTHKMTTISISTHPLKEWHPFAIFPSSFPTDPSNPDIPLKGGAGNSLIISDAGDWTHALIQSAKEQATQHLPLSTRTSNRPIPLSLYIRSSPRPGVLSLTTLFPRCIIVTTGSGIGPSLSSLLHRPPTQFLRLIWSMRAPLRTYGADMLALVHRADPEAIIIDTDEMGRPDLVAVTWKVVREVGAEAVFVLGNERVTRKVVYGLEGRGVPAFGPVWDS